MKDFHNCLTQCISFLKPPNNQVRYEITADDEDKECFLLNELTGQLLLKRSLLYEPCRAAVFLVSILKFPFLKLALNLEFNNNVMDESADIYPNHVNDFWEETIF